MAQTDLIPPSLIKAIEKGNCVAFVGSGFSGAANYPDWRTLLTSVADVLWPDNGIRGHDALTQILGPGSNPSSRELEMAAQFIYDKARSSYPNQPNKFDELLTEQFPHKERLPKGMQSRLQHLLGIPFRAIVTTNFDPLLNGISPSASTYRRLLRPEFSSAWSEESINASLGKKRPKDEQGTLIVQLHGSLGRTKSDSLVFTRSQYRQRLYANPAYLTALRALLATSPVVFLGYSLTDAYLNELRAELVEALSASNDPAVPLGWAFLENTSKETCKYFLDHEGLAVISYDVPVNSDGKKTDYSAFDKVLEDLFEKTNPLSRLKKSIDEGTILWLDPRPENNDPAKDLLRRANENIKDKLVEVRTFEEARDRLSAPNHDFRLVISHWGHSKQGGESTGEKLLQQIAQWRAAKREVPPVIIFANHEPRYPERTRDNRTKAFNFGAAAYVTEWKPLMVAIEQLMGN